MTGHRALGRPGPLGDPSPPSRMQGEERQLRVALKVTAGHSQHQEQEEPEHAQACSLESCRGWDQAGLHRWQAVTKPGPEKNGPGAG